MDPMFIGVVVAVLVAICGFLAIIVLLLTNSDPKHGLKRDRSTSKASVLAVIGSGLLNK